MIDVASCPKCGSSLGPYATQGLCPKCLLLAGLDSLAPSPAEPGPTLTPPRAAGFDAPSPAELAKRFPQLEILELVGKGGMGAVYKARQPGLDRLVAVKILPGEVSQDAAFAERFTREARALARLTHPNIIAVYDFGRADGLYYFVMEYVEGMNLRQVLQSGQIEPQQALAIVPQICDALQFAHDEGIVHRDIKPENILLDKRGRVKIADFGLAKLLGHEGPDASLTGTHQVMGTLRYMAPEQMEGTRNVDHRADIYSLGVVFYELLTGELPIGRFAPPSKKVQIDVRLDEVVLRALESKPEQRYQHASEVKTGIDEIARAKNLPIPSEPKPTARASVQCSWQIMPRDFSDFALMLLFTPAILVLYCAGPAVAVFAPLLCMGLDPSFAVGGAAAVGLTSFFALALILGLGSIQSLVIDQRGLTFHRYAGPSGFIAWQELTEIQAISRLEYMRQIWVWPGFPPRGSIVGMSALNGYRFSSLRGCWYFCPQYHDEMLAAIERFSPAAKPAHAASGRPLSTAPPRPILVPLIAMFNIATAFLLMLLIVAEDAPRVPETAGQIWRVYASVDIVLEYLTSAAFFAGGIGLLLWQPWARRFTIAVCIVSLAHFIIDFPSLVRFDMAELATEIRKDMAGSDADAQEVTVFLILSAIVAAIGVMLAGLIFQLYVLTRPRVVAAFSKPTAGPAAVY